LTDEEFDKLLGLKNADSQLEEEDHEESDYVEEVEFDDEDIQNLAE
jgi:hypothetical protein